MSPALVTATFEATGSPPLPRWLSPLLTLVALSACRKAPPTTTDRVFLIVVDGVRVEESTDDSLPSCTGQQPEQIWPEVWAQLLPEAVMARAALNLGTTITTPAHAAMLTGRRIPFGPYPIESEAGPYRPALPSLMEELRASQGLSAAQVPIFENSEMLVPLTWSLWPEAGEALGAQAVEVMNEEKEDAPSDVDAEVLAAIKARIDLDDPRLVVANLHAADRAGHYGEPDAYGVRVRSMDAPLVAFWQYLQSNPNTLDHSWLFIVADHGRHRESESDPMWRNHGDSCMGCRQVPFLVLGPGVRAGEQIESPLAIEDLGPTIAALLGVELPWADGRVASELFTQPLGSGRAGIAEDREAAGHSLLLRYTDDPEHRKVIELDGEIVASTAIEVEAASISEDGAFACWRELDLGGSALDFAEATAPWVARCFALQEGDWVEIGGPEEDVGPTWSAALLPDGEGGLWMAYGHNPHGHTEASGPAGDVALKAAHWQGSWTADAPSGELTYPTHPAIVQTPTGLLMAIAAAPPSSESRFHRQAFLSRQQEEGWTELVALDLLPTGVDAQDWRVEQPALWVEGSTTWLAALGQQTTGSTVVVVSSEDGGETWSDPQIVAQGVLPHLGPVWSAGPQVAFATTEGICLQSPSGVPTCQPLSGPRVLDFQIEGDQLTALVDQGVGVWALESHSLSAR